jgi:hypothetical protein
VARADINVAGSLDDVLRYQYDITTVNCLMIDDRQVAAYLLPTYTASDIAAIEIVDRDFGTRRHEAGMVRIYTTAFMRDLVVSQRALPRIHFLRYMNPGFCR